MENFFIRYKESYNLNVLLYHGGHIVNEHNNIYQVITVEGKFICTLSFIPKYFTVLMHSYFFISSCGEMFLINRQSLEAQSIATITGLQCYSFSPDEKYLCVVLADEVLLLDSYLDLIKSMEGDYNNVRSLCWTDGPVFAFFDGNEMKIHDISLSITASVKYEIHAIVWQSKYNVFACDVGDKIVFIEPNGREHGDPIVFEKCSSLAEDESSDKNLKKVEDKRHDSNDHENRNYDSNTDCLSRCSLCFINDQYIDPTVIDPLNTLQDDLLISIKPAQTSCNTAAAYKYTLFYTKNFKWYKKAERVCEGEFLSIDGKQVVIKRWKSICVYVVLRELSHDKSLFCSVDGKSLYITDFSNAIIPPPFYKHKVDFEEQIRGVSVNNNLIAVLTGTEFKVIRCRGEVEHLYDGALSKLSRISHINPWRGNEKGRSIGQVDENRERINEDKENSHPALHSNCMIRESSTIGESSLCGEVSAVCNRNHSIQHLKLMNRKTKPTNNVEVAVAALCIHHCSLSEYEKEATERASFHMDVDEVCVFRSYLLLRDRAFLYKVDYDGHVAFETYNNIHRLHNFGNELAILYTTGQFTYKGVIYVLNFALNMKIMLDGGLYVLSNGELRLYDLINEVEATGLPKNQDTKEICSHVYDFKFKPINTKVHSYTCQGGKLVYAKNNHLFVQTSRHSSTSRIDPGFLALCLLDNRVIGQTRHGALETFTPCVFTDEQIRRHILASEYKAAANLCMKNGVNFGVFLQHKIDMKNFVDTCTRSQCMALLTEVLKLQSYNLILESELLKRCRAGFDASKLFDYAYADGCLNRGCCKVVGDRCGCAYYVRDAYVFGETDSASHTIPSVVDFTCFVPDTFYNLLFSVLTDDTLKSIVLVKLKRTDLAMRVTRSLAELLPYATKDDLANSAILTFDRKIINEAFDLLQKDPAYALSFNNLYEVHSYLGNNHDALYEIQQEERVEDYIKKHKLWDEVLMYEVSGLSKRTAGFYYRLCARHFSAEKAIKLHELGRDPVSAFKVATEELHWEKAIELHKMLDIDSSTDVYPRIAFLEYCRILINRLIEKQRHEEAGAIAERHLNDLNLAVELYISGRSISKALGVVKSGGKTVDGDTLDTTDSENKRAADLIHGCKEHLKVDLDQLCTLLDSYAKYKARLGAINVRNEEYMTETSFSYTQNIRKSKKSVLRDRPGGRYEREFVLDKLRSIGLELLMWRDRTEELLVVFREYDMRECIAVHNEMFEKAKAMVGSGEYYSLFNVKGELFDPNRPVIKAPDLSRWF